MFNLLVTSDLTSGMHGCLTIDYTFFLDFNRTLKVRQFDKGHKNCHFWALLLKKEDILKCELFIYSEWFFLGFEKTQMSRQVANLGCKLISIVILTKSVI